MSHVHEDDADAPRNTLIPRGATTGECFGCDAPIRYVNFGRRVRRYDPDGTLHALTCKAPASFEIAERLA